MTPPTPDGWGTTPAIVAELLGPSVAFEVDPSAELLVGAANRWAWRKRWEAGYVDTPPDGEPVVTDDDVIVGCSLYAVALWRERASTDGYQSFEDFPTSTLTGGSSSQIKRLLGIPKARTDTIVADQVAAARRRRGWVR